MDLDAVSTTVLPNHRLENLRESFNTLLSSAFVRTDEQSFRKCFPGFNEQQIAALYASYRQVLFQVRGNSQAEFDVICDEAQLIQKFTILEHLCQEQNLTESLGTARESEPQRQPSETVQTQRVIAKEGELKQLTLLLEEAKERLDLDKSELNAKQELLQQKADSYKPLLSSAGPVHEASKLWNRSVTTMRAQL
ncbi:g7433 [Coccomyxa elongata]